jgi:small redox-active disulfide protein 2
MPSVTQLKIGKHMTGIVGLKEVLKEVAGKAQNLSEEQIVVLMMEKLSKKNYILSTETELYKSVFLREYKKFMGESVPELPLDCVEVKVLGAGCPNCDRLEQELMMTIAQMGIEADLEHVRDIKEISRYGVMGVPALVINRKVKAVGIVPSRADLKAFLKEAEKSITISSNGHT